MELHELGLDERIHEALWRGGLRTIEDVCARRPADLLRMRGIWTKSLGEVQQALADRGLVMRPDRGGMVSAPK